MLLNSDNAAKSVRLLISRVENMYRDCFRSSRRKSCSSKCCASDAPGGSSRYDASATFGCREASSSLRNASQVMDLKFELQSLKDAAKEKAEQEKRAHEVLARQEQENSFCEEPAAAESEASGAKSEAGGLFSPVASPRAPNPDVVYLKVSLACVDEL